MIDSLDASASLLRLLVSEGLKSWSSEALVEAAQDKSVIVRTAAVRELHARPDVDTIFGWAVSLVSSPKAETREIAAFLMGQLGSPAMPKREASYPYLTEMLDDKDEGVRASAASAIGHLSYQDMPQFVERRLVTCARDRSKHVRAAVAYALGNSSGTGEAFAALQLLLRDQHARSYAELGMNILSGRTHDGADKKTGG